MQESWGRCAPSTDGVNGPAIFEDRGPRVANSFDKAYTNGRVPTWVRERWRNGEGGDSVSGPGQAERRREPQTGEAVTADHPRYKRSKADLEYVAALSVVLDAYDKALVQRPRQDLDRHGGVRWHLSEVSLDAKEEDNAAELRVTQQAISAARTRAIEQLRETIVRVETGGAIDYATCSREHADLIIATGILWGLRRQGVHLGYGTVVPAFLRRKRR